MSLQSTRLIVHFTHVVAPAIAPVDHSGVVFYAIQTGVAHFRFPQRKTHGTLRATSTSRTRRRIPLPEINVSNFD